MRITVAGSDRSDVLGAEIAAAAADREKHPDAPEFLVEEWSALALRNCRDGADYLDTLTRLTWSKCGVNTGDFHVPRKAGATGRLAARVRKLLWRLFRYQHDRIAFQQNVINLQFAAGLEFMRDEYRRDTEQLRRRIAELETLVERGREHKCRDE